MHVIGPELILATSDLTKFARCDHATFVDYGVKLGTLKPLARTRPSAMTELIAGKGDEHERVYVESLRAAGKEVVTIDRAPWSVEALRRAEAATLSAMQRGAAYVYQAAFFDGRSSGYADLLERVDVPAPQFDGWSYEVVDIKLARSVRAHFVLQLADYSHHLARLQGSVPAAMHVVLGTGERKSFRVADFDAYHRHVRTSLGRFLVRNEFAMPYPVEFCALCDWSAHCWKQWNDADHLSLVANIRRTQVTQLERADIGTLTALAEVPPQLKIRRVPEKTFGALSHQARLQLEVRHTHKHRFEILPPEPGRGFYRLPQPAHGDVFLDLEGDPFAGDGLTYLFGVAWEEDGTAKYEPRWAHDAAGERAAFEALVDFIAVRLHEHPESHVYHYGAIEPATLKRLMGQYGTREGEIDDLLRREAFVDLAAVVRQGMRISHSSYGLKKVETFYFDRESDGVADAGGAVVAYEKWIETNDPSMLAEIQRYNREDCLSIVAMRRWLIDNRPDGVEWKLAQPPEPELDRLAQEQKNDDLYQRLLLQQPLLAHLLYYHRREERPAWWAYFERQKMSTEELFDDNDCIAPLVLDERVPTTNEKASKIFTYRFPPQEHKFEPGQPAFDARNGRKTGEIASIDGAAGVLKLRRSSRLLDEPPPAAIIPKPEISSKSVQSAVRRFAQAALDRGIEQTPYSAGTDILLRRAPRISGTLPGQPILSGRPDATAIASVVRRLEDSYLFIQGPPGSGKTYDGARAIVRLLQEGKRIGIMSSSHAAIHNLLAEIEEVAYAERFWFRGLKKRNDEHSRFVSKLPNPMIDSTSDTAACADRRVQLVAGTAWLFADESLDRSFDHLFVDEAGQVSLANALAVSTAARNVIFLGDPLQLAQVSQGSHPEGAESSVLQHLLGDDKTVPPDRGLFLEESWRMHPDVCAFVSAIVYESRLRSAAECANQAVTIGGAVQTGLRFLPVEHEGNAQASKEEAERMAAEIRRMLDGTFTSSKKVTARLQPSDFLVVAAYNAQVRQIGLALHDAGLRGIPVGTVDKFQGKQAPIVFFSMATSTGAELPRGIEFLFSRNRLNVAISRARCLAVVVASPRLLDVDCKTPEQMNLVNGLCRFVEMASRM